ncbi:TPA: sulfurtransferase complex subunit TusB [Vibrio vulnificus]|uniref:sulfurtransferase complex subunit TusB n=1 Tax=Vibrio vulnificus TaxID=672 RepID=UPI0007EE6BED|nr:sulfurtransferase complex subunit TusB [Vibrio vulnificus]ANN25311.1 tRNA 5-methylaminomethyl-2-thiouridine synthase TusB [Vibrio vulnificus]AUJ33482.1 tRNA 5-methylaminomethyl-2-thiouridine synthase [Vibrio vulnificus]EJU9788025.1 sulfurtransferase complex subunit TusB [Vibrio vulnificus]MCA3979552.1 sulfurtransferase complex subunit TusB [Vibrio vulnificus]MCA3992411.1 sulfurtransferase complex subunit TusB [Vibrio vulnificus]
MLHLIKSSHALEEALLLCTASDAIVLLEEAVYAATSVHPLQSLLPKQGVYVLHGDVLARGLESRLSTNVAIVDYHQLVDLTVEHSPCLTWS